MLYYVKSDREQLWVRGRESLSPYQFCNYITTTGATSGVGTAYLSGATEFTPSSYWCSCYILIFDLLDVKRRVYKE
jgi:hypothetical protein